MLKVKVTKKEILKNYENVISVGYCNLCWLLIYTEPKYYTCGVNGWYSDIYEIGNNTCICTGYKAFGNIKVSYDIIKKYNDKAQKIYINNNRKEAEKKINKLLNKFIEEVLNNEQ